MSLVAGESSRLPQRRGRASTVTQQVTVLPTPVDLRVHDNPVLRAACDDEQVAPLFVVDDGIGRARGPWSLLRRTWSPGFPSSRLVSALGGSSPCMPVRLFKEPTTTRRAISTARLRIVHRGRHALRAWSCAPTVGRMLAITESAAEAINALVSLNEMPEGSGARIATDDQGQGLELALVQNPSQDDTVVGGGGAKVYLDQNAAQVLGDKTLDVEQVDEDTQVRFAIVPQQG